MIWIGLGIVVGCFILGNFIENGLNVIARAIETSAFWKGEKR